MPSANSLNPAFHTPNEPINKMIKRNDVYGIKDDAKTTKIVIEKQ